MKVYIFDIGFLNQSNLSLIYSTDKHPNELVVTGNKTLCYLYYCNHTEVMFYREMHNFFLFVMNPKISNNNNFEEGINGVNILNLSQYMNIATTKKR